MFTGLVTHLGTITRAHARPSGVEFEIQTSMSDFVLGESIAVDGVCLTVKSFSAGAFAVDAAAETLAKTTLGECIAVGRRLHLERALRLSDRLGGHLVTGHVDGVGVVRSRNAVGDGLTLSFEVAPELARFVATKGSIGVNGVSLTVNAVTERTFDILLVPFTLRETLLGELAEGTRVNVETDVVAKYVARLLGHDAAPSGVTLDLLRRQGYA